ncbi:HEAT repeat domain-containing protein [Bacteroidota bacterium]
MNSLKFFLVTFLLIHISSVFIQSQNTDVQITDFAIENLKRCINSENDGVRRWGVYFAGYYKVEETVIPLLSVLDNDNDENIRVLAALSLYRIGDNRGLFAIKRTIIFDESEKVKRFCTAICYGD